MATQRVKMTIPLKGISEGKRAPVIEAEGTVGEQCRTLTEAFEQALGVTTEETLKDSFYQVEERHEHLHNGGSGEGGEGY